MDTKILIIAFLLINFLQNANSQTVLMLEEGFESGELNLPVSGDNSNPPEVILSEDARNGNYVMKSQLSNTSNNPERTEVSLNRSEWNFDVDKDYWMGLSTKLDEDFNDGDFEDKGMILQWHYRDWEYADSNKPQPFLLRYDDGKILFQSKWIDASNKNVTRNLGEVNAHIGEWDDWVINLRFSNTSGVFKVWRNGELVLDWSGDNHYAERPDGAYVKWGLYSYHYDDINYPDNPNYVRIPAGYSRTVYHDAVRIAGSDGSFDLVSPGTFEKELLLNGDFNDGTNYWQQKNITGNSLFSVIDEAGNNVAEYNVTQAPTYDYEMKLRQRNITVPSDAIGLTFKAKAAKQGTQIRAMVVGTSKPNQYIDLTTEWGDYEVPCTLVAGEAGCDVEFQFPETGTFYFDDVAFKKDMATSIVDKSTRKWKVWFASDEEQLFFQNVKTGLVEIYSVSGIKVSSFKSPVSPLNLNSLNKGLYIIILQFEKGYETIKIVK